MAYSIEHLRLPPGDDLDILVIGKTGHGKSSTCNSILRREEFATMEGFDSISSDCCVGYSRIDGRVLKVVDTPGFADTRQHTEKDQTDLVVNALTRSLSQCPRGYDAVLLVVSYIHRLNDTERKLIDCWIQFIGEEAFKTHGFLVLTYGDCFQRRYRSKQMTVQQWWNTQSVRNQWLLDKCGRRCVLFDNTTNDFVVSRQQLYDMVTLIDDLPLRGSPLVPKICQFPDLPAEVYEEQKKYVVKLVNFEKLFSLLKNTICQLGTVSDDERKITFGNVEMDAQSLKMELMLSGNKAVYAEIKEDFERFLEVLPDLRNLDMYPSGEIQSKVILAEILLRILFKLRRMVENSLYWKWVRRSVKKAAGALLAILVVIAGFAFGTG